MSIPLSARGARPPQAPGDPPWRLVKNIVFLKFWVRARTFKLPARRTAAPGCASWRRPITPPRKLQHFRPARGRPDWLPRAMDDRGPSKGGHRIGSPSNVAPLLGCATEGSWWGCHHCLDQQHCTSCAPPPARPTVFAPPLSPVLIFRLFFSLAPHTAFIGRPLSSARVLSSFPRLH